MTDRLSGPQELLEFITRKRPGKQEALRLFAPLTEEELRLLCGFDPLGDHCKTQIMRHCDERAHNGSIVGIVGNVSYKAVVDLDAGEGQAPQIAQRRIAGTKIVKR